MRVLLCDRHRLFAESLGHVLTTLGHEVFIAASPEEAQQLAATTPVDICFMELDFGIHRVVSAITALRTTVPPTQVVMLSSIDDPALLTPVLIAGAAGAVSKAADLETVLGALTRVVSSGAPQRRGWAPAQRTARQSVDRRGPYDLTPRELEVLDRLVVGEGTAAVASGMGVRHATARTHIQHVLDKMGVHSRLEAVAHAVRETQPEGLSRRQAPSRGWSSHEESA